MVPVDTSTYKIKKSAAAISRRCRIAMAVAARIPAVAAEVENILVVSDVPGFL